MTNLEQAARQALEALQLCANGEDNTMLTRDALGALRQALEQPKQEPVAWMTEYGNIMHANTRAKWVEFDGGRGCERFSDYVIPLFTAMRQVLEKQPNTMSVRGQMVTEADDPERHLVWAIEAKLKELNT